MNLKTSLSIAFFLASPALLSTSHAQTKTLYIGMNGGTMEKNYTTHIFPAFEKAHDVKVVVIPGVSRETLAKMQAQKEKQQLQVALLDEEVMRRAVSMGMCEKLNPYPVLNQIDPAARLPGDAGAAIAFNVVGIGYNKKMFDEQGWAAPDSWASLSNPKYKGKVVFNSMGSTFGLYSFVMFNRTAGGTEGNFGPGLERWPTTVGPNVSQYISNSGRMSEMLQTGEAGLFPITPTVVATLKNQGIAAEYAIPKEGSVLYRVGACVVKNGPDPQIAQKLVEYLLSAEAQTKAMEHAYIIPTNTNVKRTPGKAKVGDIDQLMKSAVTPDWDALGKATPDLIKRWNRTIETNAK
jgi:putative spermidine/putrescine transport system substrate-binding protein